MTTTTPHSPSLDVAYLARLARIVVTPEETTLFTQQLDRVLEHVNLINELDLSGVEPMAHAISVFDVVREDETKESLAKKTILDNAPHHANGLFIVPKVLE